MLARAALLLLAATAAALGQSTITGIVQAKQGRSFTPMERCLAQARNLAGEYSDEHGRFQLNFPSQPRVSVNALCEGYRILTINGRHASWLSFDCSSPGPCGEVEVVVEKRPVVDGYVVDETGEPFEGVRVELRSEPRYPGDPVRRRSRTSDDRGYVRFFLLDAGGYEIEAVGESRSEFALESSPVMRLELARGDEVTNLQLPVRIAELVDFRGRIPGLPEGVQAVKVQLRSTRGAGRYNSRMTVPVEPDGSFVVRGLPPGDYEIEAALPSSGRYRAATTLGPGAAEASLRTYEPAMLTGRLRPYHSLGVGAGPVTRPGTVQLRPAVGRAIRLEPKGADGAFRIDDMSPGRYEVRVIGPGRLERLAPDGEWKRLAEITLSEGQDLDLELRIRLEYSLLTVSVKSAGGSGHHVVGIRTEDRVTLHPTDQYGKMTLRMGPGEFEICAWRDMDAEQAHKKETWETAGDAVRRFENVGLGDVDISLIAVE